jgi:flavin reductase
MTRAVTKRAIRRMAVKLEKPQHPPLDAGLFRAVMGSFVTGITVITAQGQDEVRGMTANAFMSGSLEPPLCVISVSLKARMHAVLVKSRRFGVSILGRGQDSLIGHFAGRPVEGLDVKYDFVGGTPILARAHATLAATVLARHACGDHTLFIGHIFALRHDDSLPPLVLHRGRLASLVQSQEQVFGPILDFW